MNSDISQVWEELKRLNETHYADAAYRNQHFRKHVRQFEGDRQREIDAGLLNLFDVMSEEEYDERGHQLSLQPVTSSETNSTDDVIGYITKYENRIIKYNKKTGELVVYKANSAPGATISYYAVTGNSESARNRIYNQMKGSGKYAMKRKYVPEDDIYNTP